MPWTAIVGRSEPARRAKHAVIEHLRAQPHLRLGGSIHLRIPEGFDLLNLADGRKLPMARNHPDPEMCDYRFDHTCFDSERAWFEGQDFDVILLEAGRLEAAQRGHWPAIQHACARAHTLVVLCIRPSALAPVALELGDDPVDFVDIRESTEAEVLAFAERLVALSPVER